MSNPTTGQHVTHTLIGERGSGKVVVSGPYASAPAAPWRIALRGVDVFGAETEEVIRWFEFSDAAEWWAEGFLAAFARMDAAAERELDELSRAPF